MSSEIFCPPAYVSSVFSKSKPFTSYCNIYLPLDVLVIMCIFSLPSRCMGTPDTGIDNKCRKSVLYISVDETDGIIMYGVI